ncbi:MAG: transketolase [Elusimicrobia bacterium HGW-Elusimicrobia-3]|nr:MAG: transketolase [Elusimicrobia bacterium HGW-Elusimicrobia-3]
MRNNDRLAAQVRQTILDMICRTNGPHIGPCYSCVDLLVGLYFGGMNVSPSKSESPNRDRFVFSKGHASPALYAVLHRRGFLTDKDVSGFATNGGTFQQHPDRNVGKGIEVSTGSLGHGLPVGAGMAYALKKDKSRARVFVMISDGELDEGSTWEAILFAGHHKLNNLVLIVDYNRMHALGPSKKTLDLDPLAGKFRAFNWAAKVIDGHSFKAINKTLATLPFHKNMPSVIVAETLKGKGVSFMENDLRWHYCCPDEKERAWACREIKAGVKP